AQGIYGGVAVSGGGFALAIVPQLERLVGWRAPFVSAAAVGAVALALPAAAPRDEPRPRPEERHEGVLRDRRPDRLAANYAAALVGLASGIAFAPAFTGAALLRPDAPAAAVGLVNGASALVIVAGTPLLGLSFSLPGGGRAGFLVVAALWAITLVALPSREE